MDFWGISRISKALQIFNQSFSGPRPASTDLRLSQPGLSPSGEVCGQINLRGAGRPVLY
jgi:hypothetical protein